MANEKDTNTQRALLLDTLKRMEASLSKIYGSTYSDVLQIAQVRQAIESGRAFTWDGNPEAARQLERKLAIMAARTEQVVKNGTSAAWDIANTEGARASIGGAIGRTTKEMVSDQLEETIHKATIDARKGGATAERFYNEPQGGLTISGRVWANARESKRELQAIIQSEIAQGHSAEEALQNVKKYLKTPNEIPKYVRDKEGNPVLNEAWVNYHPGRGVYKSAYQNARRLARTEINMAYRRAEIENYKYNPLITGYEVKTSGNHESGGGLEICECLAGKYPKSFIFTGWHPQCRCHIIPITLTRKEFIERQKAINEGKENEWQPKNAITKPPKNFNDWIDNNKARIDQSKNLPFFIRDNFKIGRDAKGNLRFTLKEEIAQVKRALEEFTKKQQEARTKAERRAEIFKNAQERHAARTKGQIEYLNNWRTLHKDLVQYEPEQIAFFKDFEAKTGIKRGLSMNYEEADKQRANPKYGTSPYYKNNCQTCVPAYMLRRWGFNVEAKGMIDYLTKTFLLASDWRKTWKDYKDKDIKIKSISDWQAKRDYKRMNAKRYFEYIKSVCNEKGAIYELSVTFKGKIRDGHSCIIENRNGVLYYVDPQMDNSPGGIFHKELTLDFLFENCTLSPAEDDGVIRIDKGVKLNPYFYSILAKSAN